MNEELLHFNGVDGATGQPLIPPISAEELADVIRQEHEGTPKARRNRERNLHEKHDQGVLGVRQEYQGQEWDVSAVGWGVVYSPHTPQAVKDEIQKLIDHRGQDGRQPRIYTYDGQSADAFRLAQGQDFGVVDPDVMPYYLMLVGPPTEIPFDFQYDLDAEHAVGRIHFTDAQGYIDVQGHRDYVERVIQYEKATGTDRERRAAFFSPAKDKLTKLSADNLVKPLAEKLDGLNLKTPGKDEKVQYQTEWHRDTATWAKLNELLTRPAQKPALLFTASHGLFLDSEQDRHRQDMGALLCQDWDGSDAWGGGAVPDDRYFSGRHVTDAFDLQGLVVVSFACFSAGTPQTDELAQYYPQLPDQLAQEAFITYLPQRMLARGALAFVGHVGAAWGYSYGWPGVGFLTGTFEDVVKAILAGTPAGHATEFFNRRYLNLHHHMTRKDGWLDQYLDEKPVEKELVGVWTARNDARGYVLFGDPAIRLRPEIMT
jgi:hypothetical protein